MLLFILQVTCSFFLIYGVLELSFRIFCAIMRKSLQKGQFFCVIQASDYADNIEQVVRTLFLQQIQSDACSFDIWVIEQAGESDENHKILQKLAEEFPSIHLSQREAFFEHLDGCIKPST